MKTKLEELIQILEKEASLYEELRRLSQEEEEVVIEGNLKKLDNIVRQQEGLGVEKLPIYTSRGWTKKKTQKRKLVDQRT